MLYDVINGQTGLCVRVKVRQDNAGAKPGQGFTGLTNATSGLIVSTICDNEATATAYTAAASHVQTIATLGTYVAPSASNCRLKEVDSTNHPGLIELQIADARYAVANAKELTVTICGVTGMADCDVKIPLRAVNPYSAAFGLSLAKTTNITGFNDIAATAVVTGGAITTSSGAVSSVTTTATATNLTNLPAVPTDWLAAAGVKADAVTKIQAGLATPTNITAGTITTTTNLTNAPTAGDFTATMKTSLNAATPASVVGAVGSVTAPVTLTSAYDPAKAAVVATAQGAVVNGSTGSAVVVSGLPAGKSYAGQHLYHAASGEARTIATQSYSSPNYTFNFTGTSGTEAGPFSSVATSDVVVPVP